MRQKMIHSLRVRSQSLESLLLSLQRSRADLQCPTAMQECAYCRGSHAVGSYTRCDLDTSSDSPDRSRCWIELQPCHRLKKFGSSHIRSPASQIDPSNPSLNASMWRNAEIPDANTRTIALDYIHEEIKSVHSSGLCELRMRNLATKVLTIIRSWLARKRFQKLIDMTVAIKQLLCREILKAVSQPCVRFCELDRSITRIRRRYSRKFLYTCWLALGTELHESSYSSDRGHRYNKTKVQPNQVICSKILAKKKSLFKKWRSLVFSQKALADTKYLAYQTSVEPRCSIDSVADRVAQMASLVCRAMHFTEISLDEVARNLAIARRCLSVDTGLLKNSFVSWAGWVKSLSEGRLIPRVPLTAPAQGTKASLETRFRAPHDFQTAARISRSFQLLRYIDAWRSRAALLGSITQKQRMLLTDHLRLQLSAWNIYAARLKAARQVALDRWCAHVARETSGPLRAWYLWANMRRTRHQDSNRLVAMFARLKCRHSAATALRAWRHAAQFNHFEARYTRRELIAALSEQKGHIRRLEKCVDDHYIVRGELEHVVKDAHERAARLARLLPDLDAKCKQLEENLQTVEVRVASAQRYVSAVEVVRSALTQSILQMQPGVGFIDRDLATFAHDHGIRLEVEMIHPNMGFCQNVLSPPPTVCCKCTDANASTGTLHLAPPENAGNSTAPLEPQDDKVPHGMVLVCPPNRSGGILLCRHEGDDLHSSTERSVMSSDSTDVIKVELAARVGWLVNLTRQSSPLVDFRRLSHIGGTPLTTSHEASQEISHDTTGLFNVPTKLMHEAALLLIHTFREMQGIFEFLREGNTSALSSRLLASWGKFCALTMRKPVRERRKITTSAYTWADLTWQLNGQRQHGDQNTSPTFEVQTGTSHYHLKVLHVPLYSGRMRWTRCNDITKRTPPQARPLPVVFFWGPGARGEIRGAGERDI